MDRETNATVFGSGHGVDAIGVMRLDAVATGEHRRRAAPAEGE